MKTVFILDDNNFRHEMIQSRITDRIPEAEFTSAMTYDQAIDILSKNKFDIICLDHNIGGRKTGVDVAEFVTNLPEEQKPAMVIVHSLGIDGPNQMFSILKEAGITFWDERFDWPIVDAECHLSFLDEWYELEGRK